MRRLASIVVILLAVGTGNTPAGADGDTPDSEVKTIEEAVRVTVVKSGGSYRVGSVSGGRSAGPGVGCTWTVVFAPELEDAPFGTSPGPKPDPGARFALLLCDGAIVRAIWVAPADVVDLDALVRTEAERYIEDVLIPEVRIGVNPAAQGLAGLRSWFWIEGFSGSVTAPPITAFGVTIDVRMTSRFVTWDFGDGIVEPGDLGLAYPAESTVQHAHQRAGSFTVAASLDLAPEYRVDGGPWITLPDLQAQATTQHDVQQRQAVITNT